MIVWLLAAALVVVGIATMLKGSDISSSKPDDGLHYRDSDPAVVAVGHVVMILGIATAVFGLLLLVGGVGL